MTRYQLAKLVAMAGKLESRKRLQKMIYLLKAAGCPIDAEYGLHLYGPYSQDVACLVDDMVSAGILKEKVCGKRFDYVVRESIRPALKRYERNKTGQAEAKVLERFADRINAWAKEDLWQLELASTVLFFHKQGFEWPQALDAACEFKNVLTDDEATKKALKLAKSVA